MKPLSFRNLLIHLELYQEPENVWWPKATIEDPVTGEVAPVAMMEHKVSREDAARYVVIEARRRIRTNTWHN